MNTVYILCNSENKKSGNYIQYGGAGSSLGRYVANSIGKSEKYSAVILNLGSPSKKTKSIKKTMIYEEERFKIVEFKSSLRLIPPFLRAKKVLNEAVKYLKNNFKSGDKVLIYHSLSYLEKYKDILDIAGMQNSLLLVAEIYSDVLKKTGSKKNFELNKIRLFNKFICMSKNLSNTCCVGSHKKSILLFGAYTLNKALKKSAKINGNRIDVVYSGTASKTKNGLYMAIDAMNYLDSNFMLHVYCPPTQAALDAMKNRTNVVYEGYIDESALNEILPKYDIGLASQDPSGDFNESSFPSKIIKYLSCGLSVVSSASVSVLDSPFIDVISIFKPYEPETLAKSIVKASKANDFSNNTRIIKQMDLDFRTDVVKLIEMVDL